MERNHIIGILLIIAVLFLWNQYFFQPEMEEQMRQKQMQDSISRIQQPADTDLAPEIKQTPDSLYTPPDSSNLAPVVVEEEKTAILENSLLKLELTNKGGHIISALIKNHKISYGLKKGEDPKSPVILLDDKKNIFEYRFKHNGKEFSSKELSFEVQQPQQNTVNFIAHLDGSAKFIQSYSLAENNYTLNYSIRTEGMNGSDPIQLHWENQLPRLETNSEYEQYNSTVYFKEKEEDPDYCSCRSDDKLESTGKRIQWVSHSNQFFNSSLIAKDGFSKASYETILLGPEDDNLKKLVTDINIEPEDVRSKDFAMNWFIGPNEYKGLDAFHVDLQYIIPYGWSIFGTLNRHVVRPMFSFLSEYIGSKGLIIILITLIVKLVLFPLGYKMLHSQAKMQALKPEIDKVKVKFKDDMQKQQMETMKMYNEFGVNPLGGCFPMLLQMPIWIALYRFFPASIEFRQASFWWAADLTSYDEFLTLPFSLPLFGDAISLFAFLWMVSTIIFSYYSSKFMDFSANPAMKYMQYLMPVIFWFMFNKTAAGLTCYMFFSNVFNIGQTILGKTVLFDQDKIRLELNKNKAKPRKQGGFRDRLEQMMKEQQRIQQEKAKQNKK